MIGTDQQRFDPELCAKFSIKSESVSIASALGVTATLLANLYDLVRTFGINEKEANFAWLSFTGVIPACYVCCSLRADDFCLVILGPDGVATLGSSRIWVTNDFPVVWDKCLESNDLKAFITAVDTFMETQGGIDQATGKRKVVPMPQTQLPADGQRPRSSSLSIFESKAKA